jgi:ABC-type dipeptide/oligopeptide/nickel transport system permease subunit
VSSPSTGGDQAVALEGLVVRSHPLLRKAAHNRSLITGATILVVLVLLAALAPVIDRYPPLEQDLTNILAPPSWAHWLGTDQLGRDVWSRLLWAGRFDLATGFLVVLIPFTVGTTIGTLAGYYKGWPDTVLAVRTICVLTELGAPAVAVGALLAPGAATTASAMTKKAWRITSPLLLAGRSLSQNGAARHIAHGCSPT